MSFSLLPILDGLSFRTRRRPSRRLPLNLGAPAVCTAASLARSPDMYPGRNRLYVALYARGGEAKMPGLEDKYHWAFIIGPKTETPDSRGLLCQVKNGIGSEPAWYYEACAVCMRPTPRLLVRVVVAKVRDRERLEAALRDAPVGADSDGWNGVEWTKEALARLARDGRALGSAVTEWRRVRDRSTRYVDEKRRAGRFGRDYDSERTPTWCLLKGEELIP